MATEENVRGSDDSTCQARVNMAQDESQDAADPPAPDARAIASIIKAKPPVPLLPEGGQVVDRFGSDEVAKGLADIIEKVEPPYTISISGS